MFVHLWPDTTQLKTKYVLVNVFYRQECGIKTILESRWWRAVHYPVVLKPNETETNLLGVEGLGPMIKS